MNSLKIALFVIIATLFSLPAAASSFDQGIEFELDSAGNLTGIRAPTGWNVDSALEFGLLYADLIQWDFEMENAVHLCDTATCQVRLTALDVDGDPVTTTTLDIQLGGSGALFPARIVGIDVNDANTFFGNLVLSAVVRLEIQPELAAQRVDDKLQTSVWVHARYNGAVVACAHAVLSGS